ncbi:CooT family nickel-binding protein [Thermosulfurimonas sp. F29]|uniref:CooT family nickel-binding protein n=1 Tax=Thermosulfurimonas sp. F29 TaxID=2867247 RepID=UPI001C833FFE|nr:CooT family nickel-binding protein [Thermosulfurimonas sp. F29]MBX6423946.1 CooT family nickel-binding protein [Thermosulfurimonas sp. F29]
MCQARVIVRRGEEEEEVMRDVVGLEVQPDGVVLRAFFEEPRRIRGRLKEIDFMKHVVVVEEES